MGTDRCEIYLRDGADGLTPVGHSPDGDVPAEQREGGLLHYVVEQGSAAVVHGDGTLKVIGNPLQMGKLGEGVPVALNDLTTIGIPLITKTGICAVA